jgi:CheY-like chemotaxis protein
MADILIIDDTKATREMLRMLFEDMGYEVIEAPDGASGLEALRAAHERMIVLVDLLMPTMTGLEVLHAVAGDALLSYAHAYVLMTAEARSLPNDADALLDSLGVRTIHKPFDLDLLLETVAQLTLHQCTGQPSTQA